MRHTTGITDDSSIGTGNLQMVINFDGLL